MTASTLRRVAPVLMGAALLVAPAAAQETEAERENCICIGGEAGEFRFGPTVLRQNRAQIGVMLGEAVEVDGRTGTEVVEVVEDGPAEAAGLQAGDIITALDGTELGDEPAAALVEAMADVEPGATVTLTYYRDGGRRTASVVTREATGMALFRPGRGDLDVRVMPRVAPERIRERMGEFSWITPRTLLRRLSPGGLELVEMNPGLGEYFGTDEGVLVASVAEDSELGLQPGDVILAIDGRDVRDPAHVRSILESYRNDEEITFRVVRQERRIEVTGTIRD